MYRGGGAGCGWCARQLLHFADTSGEAVSKAKEDPVTRTRAQASISDAVSARQETIGRGVDGSTPETVPRVRLVSRLLASKEPVVSVVAPPGYGKSTLLSQWAERAGPRIAWVSCDRIHDDPGFLWTAVVTALSQIDPQGMHPARLVSRDAGHMGRHLAELIGGFTQPVTVVLDQLEAISSPKGRGLVGALGHGTTRGIAVGLGVAGTSAVSPWPGSGFSVACWSWAELISPCLVASRRSCSACRGSSSQTKRQIDSSPKPKDGRRRSSSPLWGSVRLRGQPLGGSPGRTDRFATTCVQRY